MGRGACRSRRAHRPAGQVHPPAPRPLHVPAPRSPDLLSLPTVCLFQTVASVESGTLSLFDSDLVLATPGHAVPCLSSLLFFHCRSRECFFNTFLNICARYLGGRLCLFALREHRERGAGWHGGPTPRLALGEAAELLSAAEGRFPPPRNARAFRVFPALSSTQSCQLLDTVARRAGASTSPWLSFAFL